MSDITIYGPPQSTYVRTVRTLCAEKDADYELQPIEFGSAAHLALHPFGRVPIVRHGSTTIYETSAICFYLNEALPGTSLVPDDLTGRTHMHRWISCINDYCYQTMIREVVLPKVGVGQRSEQEIADSIEKAAGQLAVFDRDLGSRGFAAGDTASVADLLLAPIVFYLNAFPDTQEAMADCANLRRWFDAIASRETFRGTAPPMG